MTLVEGATFCISEPGGDILPGPQGLFVRDTRVLRWELGVYGRALHPLKVQQAEPHAAAFVSRLSPPAGLAGSSPLVVRRHYVGNGMRRGRERPQHCRAARHLRGYAPPSPPILLTCSRSRADGRGGTKPLAWMPGTRRGGSPTAGVTAITGLLVRGYGRTAAEGVLRWQAAVPARGKSNVSVEAFR